MRVKIQDAAGNVTFSATAKTSRGLNKAQREALEVARATVSYVCYDRGNLAIQQEIWTMPVIVAKAAMKAIGCPLGSYWHSALAVPTRRAVRNGQGIVQIRTAGFTTGEFSNVLSSIGCRPQFAGDL